MPQTIGGARCTFQVGDAGESRLVCMPSRSQTWPQGPKTRGASGIVKDARTHNYKQMHAVVKEHLLAVVGVLPNVLLA